MKCSSCSTCHFISYVVVSRVFFCLVIRLRFKLVLVCLGPRTHSGDWSFYRMEHIRLLGSILSVLQTIQAATLRTKYILEQDQRPKRAKSTPKKKKKMDPKKTAPKKQKGLKATAKTNTTRAKIAKKKGSR